MQQLVYRDGKATFELAKLNYNLPNAIQPSKFVPEPTAADNTTLFKLATDSMYEEIKKVIDVGLKSTLTNILANESFSNPFGGESYTYNFGNLNITFSSHMANVSFLEQGGLEVGYNMSIVGGTPVCSSFVPSDVGREASFITLELIQSIFGYAAANNSDWSSKVLNYSNTNSDVFQFYMIDLEDILPKALVDYPSLLTRTEARCGIQTGSTSITLDAVYGMVRASVTWDCDLSIANTDIKLISKVSCERRCAAQDQLRREADPIGKHASLDRQQPLHDWRIFPALRLPPPKREAGQPVLEVGHWYYRIVRYCGHRLRPAPPHLAQVRLELQLHSHL